MKKILPLLLLTITLLGAILPQNITNAKNAQQHNIQTATKRQTDKVVYINQSDTKYHRSHCRHKEFTRSIKLSSAKKAGFTPCTKCRP